MSTYRKVNVLAVLGVYFFFCGCSTTEDTVQVEDVDRLTDEEAREIVNSDEILGFIRSTVLKRFPRFSDEEKAIILQSPPQTGSYVIAGSFGQYFWGWELGNGRSIRAGYVGDIALPLSEDNMTIMLQ